MKEAMMSIETINHDGRQRIVMDVEDYQNLIDARDAEAAMRRIDQGGQTVPDAELDDYLLSATPLAFWRKRSGKTQAGLAQEVGISQPFLAQLEAGSRVGGVAVLARLAKSVGVRIEDLLAD